MNNGNNLQKITYTVNFNNKNKTLYTSKCDFDLENSKIDFNKCPIIAEISAVALRPIWNVNSFISLDIDVGVLDKGMPKLLKNPAVCCANCSRKHCERGAN